MLSVCRLEQSKLTNKARVGVMDSVSAFPVDLHNSVLENTLSLSYTNMRPQFHY